MPTPTKNINAEKIQGDLSIDNITASTISAATYQNLPSSPITIGTTSIVSGAEGRILFQSTGNTAQQDSQLFWDNTNKRLGIGKTPAASSAKAVVAITDATANQNFYLTLRNLSAGYGSWGFVKLGSNDLGINYQTDSDVPQGGTSIRFYYGGQIGITSSVSIGNIGTPSARLDVRAQGALSTDIAFRVRNSADSADIFSIRGNGEMYIPQAQSNNQNIIYIAGTTDSIIRYSPIGIGSIAFGQGASITNATYYNTAIGNSATAGASAAFGISIGFSTIVNSSGGIAIGDRAKTSGTDTIVIGNTGGNTTYSGTRSIHLGRKGNFGNDIIADDVFMTYFNSDNSSTLTRANGSFGLLGKGAYIFQNGTGIYGTDTFMGNGGNTLVVRNHASIPSTNVADSFQQYSADIVAGNAAPHFRTENGSIIKLYQETTGVTASTLVGGGGTTITDTDTFDGYTLQQVVKALKNLGILQ